MCRACSAAGWFLTSLASFLTGLWPGSGMFFETVNRIWRMDCPPMWLQRWGDGAG